jgi:hypothetical protein
MDGEGMSGPSDKQIASLQKFGVSVPTIDALSFQDASQLLGIFIGKLKRGEKFKTEDVLKEFRSKNLKNLDASPKKVTGQGSGAITPSAPKVEVPKEIINLTKIRLHLARQIISQEFGLSTEQVTLENEQLISETMHQLMSQVWLEKG